MLNRCDQRRVPALPVSASGMQLERERGGRKILSKLHEHPLISKIKQYYRHFHEAPQRCSFFAK